MEYREMPGWIDRILRRLGYTKARETGRLPSWMLDWAGWERWEVPDYSRYENQADLYRRLSWVKIAVNAVAAYSASTALSVKQLDGEKRVDVENHPFELLLRRPNPLQSRYELLYSTFASLPLTGNAYWWLNRLNEDTPPDEIWYIPSHQIIPIPDDRLFIRGYEFNPGNGTRIMLQPWEVVHFMRYNPMSPFFGMSDIEAIATQAVGDMKQTQWNARLFGENNARLPGFLIFRDMIGDTEWEKIKQDIKSAAEKRQYMMLRGAGDGVTWLQAAATQRDMEFIAGRNFTREEIFAVIAPGLANILSVNATEANALAGKATFMELAIYPQLTAVGEKITNDLMPVYGENFVAEFDDVRISNRSLELQEQQVYAQSHTLDEVRARWYDDSPIGDERGQLMISQVKAGGGGRPEGTMSEPASAGEANAPGTRPNATSSDIKASRVEASRVEAELVEAELSRWRRKAMNALKASKPASVRFVTQAIPRDMANSIQARLATATTAADVEAAFDVFARAVRVEPAAAELVEAEPAEAELVEAEPAEAEPAEAELREFNRLAARLLEVLGR